jgi:hypothetical protein
VRSSGGFSRTQSNWLPGRVIFQMCEMYLADFGRPAEAVVHYVVRNLNSLLLGVGDGEGDRLTDKADRFLGKQRLIESHSLIIDAAFTNVFVRNQVHEGTGVFAQMGA